MPIYEYQCEKCATIFDELQSGFEEREMECPECGGNSKRVMSNTSFILKGSGWYTTDYAGKKPHGGDESASDSGEGSSSAKDSGAVDSGVQAKPETAPSKTESASPGSSS